MLSAVIDNLDKFISLQFPNNVKNNLVHVQGSHPGTTCMPKDTMQCRKVKSRQIFMRRHGDHASKTLDAN